MRDWFKYFLFSMSLGEDLIDPPYQNATTAVITFVVNNKYKKEDSRPAKEWEKAYVEFMKNYLENDKPSFMEIAFSSERSIEDELERQSSGEVVTVLVSYLIMFVYISVALGEVNSISRILASILCLELLNYFFYYLIFL
jgi:Niemann-Pick C1 protein